MENQTATITGPLAIFNFEKSTLSLRAKFLNSIKSFREEILRALTEDYKISLPPQETFGIVKKHEKGYEFNILHNVRRYSFGFIIQLNGKIDLVLYEDKRKNMRDQNPLWIITKPFNLLDQKINDISAEEAYALLPFIVKWLN